MLSWATAYLIFEWGLRLVMLLYVPQRRPPAAARTWLLLIFIQPVVGVLLYAAFGRPHLSRRRRELQDLVMQVLRDRSRRHFAPYAARPELPPQFRQAVTLATNLGDFPIARGNSLELLTDYDRALERLVADIDAARHHVHLLYYIFADDRTGRSVAAALERARARGVECTVLMDSLGSKGARRALAPDLRRLGIEVRELLPWGPFNRKAARIDLRNHRKIAVIDGRVAHVGSQNIVDADFKPGLIYEETVVRLTGPALAQLQAVFLADRFFEAESGEKDEAFFPEPEQTGTALVQSLPSGPGFPYANTQRLLVALVHAAQERIVFTTPYFIPDEALLQALQTAVLRGVQVHLVMPEQADQFLVCFAQRSFFDELLESGVKIHLYGRQFLHAKHASFDDAICLVGSSNFDIRSFQLNAEISLIVYDREFVQTLRQVEAQHMAAARELTAAEWRRRPLTTRLVQNTARLVDSVL
ncbi:MAG: cardiolipin synthase [Planctomycetaceae bacterium]